jgi:uncharacterized FAD-dependent dehydrogenase
LKIKKYTIRGIKLSPEQNLSEIYEILKKSYKIEKEIIKDLKILKESIDARKKDDIKLVYTVLVSLSENLYKSSNISEYTEKKLSQNIKPGKKLKSRPIIVGSGPAGLFSALILAGNGYNPIILERGSKVPERVKAVNTFWKNSSLNTETNVQFGEGGAGTFSDGKLTTRINDHRCSYVLNELVRFGAPDEILYKAKPHIGTDNLRKTVINMRKEIESLGGTFYFDTKLTDIRIKNGKITEIKTSKKDILETEVLILAIGHSARDTFEMLFKKSVFIEPKPFSVGFRIEHIQKEIDEIRYGKFAGHQKLGHAEYSLFEKINDKTVYTFCMCPGGVVVGATSEENAIVTNGMSFYRRDNKNSNSALVCSIKPEDFGKNPMDGIMFQRKWERNAYNITGSYKAPVQRLDSFIDGKYRDFGKTVPGFTGETAMADLNKCFPEIVIKNIKTAIPLLNKRLKGFDDSESVLTGVETRTSSPVRIKRNKEFESINIEGLYPAGEGAGYAGGIMSAAVDGIKAAEKIMEKWAKKDTVYYQ